MTASPQFLLMLGLLGLPAIEIAVLIAAGSFIGFLPTVGLLVLSAVVGALIIRHQGISMLSGMVGSVSGGAPTFAAMTESSARIAGGLLLIVPGFVTDVFGLILLVPPLRRALLRLILPGARSYRRDDMARPSEAGTSRGPGQPIIIDGTYKRLDDDEAGPPA